MKLKPTDLLVQEDNLPLEVLVLLDGPAEGPLPPLLLLPLLLQEAAGLLGLGGGQGGVQGARLQLGIEWADCVRLPTSCQMMHF